MSKANLTYITLGAIWLAIALIAFIGHASTAVRILPIFTVGAVLFAAWVTFSLAKGENQSSNGNEKKEQNSNNEKQSN